MARPEERDFAGFRIVRPLELGERASVWEAEDLESGERVAIETLAGDGARDDDVVEWFTEAWELASGLDCRGIVSVLRIGEQDGVPFAVRTPAGHECLADRFDRGGPLSAGAALQVLTETGEALEAAHEAGLVHGALEPACVVLDEHGRAHLAGFGRREGDRREDVSALGALLVEMLGDPPEKVVDGEKAEPTGPGEGVDEADAGATEADGGDDFEDHEPEVPSRWEAGRAEALRDVGRAGVEGEYARAADLVAAARAARPPRDAGDRGGERSRGWLAVALVAAAALLAVILIASGGGGDDGGGSAAAPTVAETPPPAGPARPIPVRGFPAAVAASDGVVYAVTRDGGSLDGFDEETGERVLGPVELGGEGRDVTVAGGAVWVTAGGGAGLARIDLAAEDPAAAIVGAGSDPGPLVVARDSVWVLDAGERRLLRFPADPADGAEPEITELDAGEPAAITFGRGALWIADARGRVLRVDPEDPSQQRPFDVGGEPGSVLVVAGDVWLTDERKGEVSRLDPATGKTDSLPVGGAPIDVAAGAGHLWVANADGYVTAIDLATGAIEQIDLSGAGGSPQAITAGRQVWVATGSGNTLVAIAPAGV